MFYMVNVSYLGTEILTVQAADNDDPKTDNVRIFYRLIGQIPESPRALFRVDRDSGVISVQADSMEGTAPQYTLTITAEDAKGVFIHKSGMFIVCRAAYVVYNNFHTDRFVSFVSIVLASMGMCLVLASVFDRWCALHDSWTQGVMESRWGTDPESLTEAVMMSLAGLNSSCTVVVTVQDENNNPPVFSQHEVWDHMFKRHTPMQRFTEMHWSAPGNDKQYI